MCQMGWSSRREAVSSIGSEVGPENPRMYLRSCCVLAAGFFGVFLAPVPNPTIRTVEQTWLRERGPAGIAIVGNSVVDHSSICDTDRRTIPEMIAAKTGSHVRDLSYGGQGIEESLSYAAQALKTQPVVFFVSAFSFSSQFSVDLRSRLFFRLIAGRLHATSLIGQIAAAGFGDTPVSMTLQPYIYKGRRYPDYDGIKANYFKRERDLMGCPETIGNDLDFIEGAYWNNYVRSSWQMAHVDDLATLSRRSVDSKHPLRVVMLPVDRDDIAVLSESLATLIQQRTFDIVLALKRAGVPLIDLSSTLASDSFADRWCACGHLVEKGREEVASRVAAALTSGE